MAMALFGEIDDTTIALGGKIDHVIIAGGRLLTSAARRRPLSNADDQLDRHPEIPSDDQPTLSSKYLKSRGPRYTNIWPALRFFIPFAIGFQLCFLLSSTKNTQETFFDVIVEETGGWRNIPIFVGSKDMFDKPKDLWYGESNQDIAVISLLKDKRNGFFVDLASNDPIFLSNTYALERKFNWTGLCIEPNTDHWWALSQTRTCQLVGAVVGQKTMDKVKFLVKNIDGTGGHGGIIGKGMKNENAPDSDSKSFATVAVDDIFRRLNVPRHIDYLSLDVEGAEEFIMRVFPFKVYHISLLSIETVKPSFQTFLVDNGFKMVARLGGEDTLWAHESIKNELDPVRMSIYSKSLWSNDPQF